MGFGKVGARSDFGWHNSASVGAAPFEAGPDKETAGTAPSTKVEKPCAIPTATGNALTGERVIVTEGRP